MKPEIKIAVSSGELSGDEHAAGLVHALRSFEPRVSVRGMGGHHSREAGAEIVVDSEHAASVMGFQEVALSFGKIVGAFRAMQRLLSEWRPSLLVVIDYPDFHFRLVRFAKSLGIKVLYFIPPQIWAWRTGRAEFLARHADELALIFPFERDFYRRHGLERAVYVGHPFTATFPALRGAFRDELLTGVGLDPERPTLALLPGSRRNEIRRLLPVVIRAFTELRGSRAEVQGVIPIASGSLEAAIAEQVAGVDGLAVLGGRALDLLRVADAGLLKSGTSNLQAVFADLPFSMFYRAPLLSELIVRLAVKVDSYSIVNLIRRGTVREILQREVTAPRLAEEAGRLLFDAAYRERIRAGASEVRAALATHDDDPRFAGCATPYERAARLALTLA